MTTPSILRALELAKTSSTQLQLDYDSGVCVREPGKIYAKSDMQKPPKVSSIVGSGKYIVVAIDIDAPFPSWNKLGPIWHWMQADLSASTPQSNAGGFNSLTTSTFPVVDYIGPNPPPGSGPHRYLFMLYAEPNGFDPKAHGNANGEHTGNWARMWCNLEKLEARAGLGPILAANYLISAP